jgi:hypothetical protein
MCTGIKRISRYKTEVNVTECAHVYIVPALDKILTLDYRRYPQHSFVLFAAVFGC